MAERATEQIVIAATPEELLRVLLDFERYPVWAADIKDVEVRERDDEGRGTLVAYRAAAMGQSARYTLAYDYSDIPKSMSWKLVEGSIMRVLDGSYTFEAQDPGTLVTYHLEVDLIVPIPGFVKRRAEGKIMGTALRELKKFVEST
ncbi:MAG: SRPBCC family protein [Acidimicrobiia bacterium]|nr:SRPBCC family protein [Acidimicrobiia bacterium]